MYVKKLDENEELLLKQRKEKIGYQNFVREEGILMDYQDTADIYRKALKNIRL